MQQKKPDDFIISTGKLHSVRDFVQITFSYLDYVKIDPKYFRESEEITLCGDDSKIKKITNWNDTTNLSMIIKNMINNSIGVG
jgi:GDPmannose 4,6-dehydratase